MDLSLSLVSAGNISRDNVSFYRDYGFLIANDALNKSEINELKKETAEIFRGKRGAVEGLVDVADNETDENVLKKYLAIHFPHKMSAIVKKYLSHPHILNVLTELVSPNVKCMQSMLFVKAPGKAGQAWHQDEFFIPTRDKSLIGAWIAIDDATIDNGCLWIIPGSHKPGIIMQRVSNRDQEFADTDTINVDDIKAKPIPIEVKSGSIVYFNGYVLHSSLKNKTDNNFRMALVNHYMSAESMLPWDQDGKLRATDDLRDIILVAGTDPYHYKGMVDLNKPYLRPDVLTIKTDRK
jgi:phytanoyl-CoA hydroxylase